MFTSFACRQAGRISETSSCIHMHMCLNALKSEMFSAMTYCQHVTAGFALSSGCPQLSSLRGFGGLPAAEPSENEREADMPLAMAKAVARAPSNLRQFLERIQSEEYMEQLAQGVRSGSRLAISQAITLCESTRVDHATKAAELLRELEKQSPGARLVTEQNDVESTFRIGVSGPPGVGKSSLIESLGCHIADTGEQVAVLAIDPSSKHSGGAILGDKTRMPRLSTNPRAFVRPTPARGTLGGVARATSDAIIICEAAGYTQVLVETVGVGQSETTAADLVDCLLLVMPPVGGDELQVIKKGIMEVADVIAVNKADGPTANAAMMTVANITGTLGLIRHPRTSWFPKVIPVSAHSGMGIPELWETLQDFHDAVRESGELHKTRREQHRRLMWMALEELVLEQVRADPHVTQLLEIVGPEVDNGWMAPRVAADTIARYFHEHSQ